MKLGLPINFIIKPTIFQLFCGGEDIDDCKNTINKLHKYKVGTILDYSVEGEDDEESFEKTKKEILETIDMAAKYREEIPFSVFKVTGIGSRNLLTKVQAKQSLSDAERKSYANTVARFKEVCAYAAVQNVRLFVDAEETWIQDVIDELSLEEMKLHNKANALIYNTYQMYRNESYHILERHIAEAKAAQFLVGAKLVRGAYMEKERERAGEMGYKDPINKSKPVTDDEYNKAVTLSIENIDHIHICLGTHNEDSCKLAAGLMLKNKLDSADERIYFAQLLGMSDNISFNLANAGYNVAKYVPYGPISAVMPYLFRRADENTSIAGQSSREFLLIQKEKERRKTA